MKIELHFNRNVWPNVSCKKFLFLVSIFLIFLNGCASTQKPRKHQNASDAISTSTIPSGTLNKLTIKPEKQYFKDQAKNTFSFERKDWSDLPGWENDDLTEAWPAFLQSCSVLKKNTDWARVCLHSGTIKVPSQSKLKKFFQIYFTPYQIFDSKRTSSGLITGYYEPLLKGQLIKSEKFKYPLLGMPRDLRIPKPGTSKIIYYSRKQIEENYTKLNIPVVLWVENEIDLFFLQIQGSGRVALPSGKILKIGYASHNGHPYTSIGKVLIKEGEVKSHEASMQGIKAWAKRNPWKVKKVLNQNERYVFFKIISNNFDGPIGALNVPLTPKRSLAVDSKIIPLGFPIYLSTTWPSSERPMNKLMLAQDTGGAIKGPLRGDFFWGFGNLAGQIAGKMKQSGKMWILIPKGMKK